MSTWMILRTPSAEFVDVETGSIPELYQIRAEKTKHPCHQTRLPATSTVRGSNNSPAPPLRSRSATTGSPTLVCSLPPCAVGCVFAGVYWPHGRGCRPCSGSRRRSLSAACRIRLSCWPDSYAGVHEETGTGRRGCAGSTSSALARLERDWKSAAGAGRAVVRVGTSTSSRTTSICSVMVRFFTLIGTTRHAAGSAHAGHLDDFAAGKRR